MKPICGAYKLVHEPTGQYILGSTDDVVKAVADHLLKLQVGKHPLARLQGIYHRDPDVRPYYWLTSTLAMAEKVEADLRKEVPDPFLLINPRRNTKAKASARGKLLPLDRELGLLLKKSIAAAINKKNSCKPIA